MRPHVPLSIAPGPGSPSTGPARSACGGPAPTSSRRAHSRPAAGPSDPSLRPLADERPWAHTAVPITDYKRLESLTQTEAEKFQLNCVPRHSQTERTGAGGGRSAIRDYSGRFRERPERMEEFISQRTPRSR